MSARASYRRLLADLSRQVERAVGRPSAAPAPGARRLYLLPGEPRAAVYQHTDGSRQVRVTDTGEQR